MSRGLLAGGELTQICPETLYRYELSELVDSDKG